MKKRMLSVLLVLMMVVGMIPATTLATSAASGTAIGVIYEAEGFEYDSVVKGYYPTVKEVTVKLDSGESVSAKSSCYTGPLFADADYTSRLETELELDKTYYFYFRLEELNLDHNITNANSSINVSGCHNGKILSVVMKSDGDIVVHCSVVYGELTGGVKAVASGVEYDSAEGGYAPNFTTLKAVSTEGKELEHTMVDGKYSYYGAKSGCLYKTNSGTSFSNMLTTEPQAGETYYSYFLLDSIDANLNIEEELVDIQIPGYEVEYLASYERDMGFTSLVVYSVTKTATSTVLLGDVDGDTDVTAADALEVLKSVVGKVTLTETQVAAADTDGNGKVDAADALNILKKVVGKIDQFPVEQ